MRVTVTISLDVQEMDWPADKKHTPKAVAAKIKEWAAADGLTDPLREWLTDELHTQDAGAFSVVVKNVEIDARAK